MSNTKTKKIKLFLNFFGKSKSNKLETDSVPIDDIGSQVVMQDNSYNNTINNSTNNATIYMRQPSETSVSRIPPQNTDRIPPDSESMDWISVSNSSLSMNQTQEYNVYQFSHINGLHIGSAYTINTNNNTSEQVLPNNPFRKTKTIDAMMKCTDPIVYKTMDIVSTHLGQGWRDVVRHLGFSDGQIGQIFEDNYAKGIKEVIYLFLLDYKRNDDDASLGHLTKILWKTGHKETVFILKKHWKNGDLQENDRSNGKEVPSN